MEGEGKMTRENKDMLMIGLAVLIILTIAIVKHTYTSVNIEAENATTSYIEAFECPIA